MRNYHPLQRLALLCGLLLCLSAVTVPAQARAWDIGVAISPRERNVKPNSEFILSAFDRSTGQKIPSHELSWSTDNPEIQVNSDGRARFGPAGTEGHITVSWKGSSDQATFHVIPYKEQILFAMVASFIQQGNSMKLEPMDFKMEDFPSDYTLHYTCDDPQVIHVEQEGMKARCTAVGYGEATVTAVATWPDGTVRKAYCDFFAFNRERKGAEEVEPQHSDSEQVTPKPEPIHPEPESVEPKPVNPEPVDPEPLPSEDLLPAPGEGIRSSGCRGMEKLSQEEIQALLQQAPTYYDGELFDVQPKVSSPYAPGRLSDGALQAVTNRLNALRRIAGLAPVQWSREISDRMQHGAVVCAALDELTHHPQRPADMDEAFYKIGLSATSSSNLAAGYQFFGTPDGWMDDSDDGNISRLGHRRWQLNPSMGKTGFGYAKKDRHYAYSAEYSFDQSAQSGDYDFVAWPASGNFPQELFGNRQAWSVSPNLQHYKMPELREISVTLTRESDGRSWQFGSGSSDGYFNVDQNGYGTPGCIIFRPDGVTGYEGVYQVEIHGLKDQSGRALSDFRYQVDFFGGESEDESTIEAEPTPSLPEKPEKPQKTEQPKKPVRPEPTEKPREPHQKTQSFTDIPSSHWASEAIGQAVELGVVQGYQDGSFQPQRAVTSAHFNAMLARAFHPEELSDPGAAPWWTPNVAVNSTHGILRGTQLEQQFLQSGSYGSRLNEALSRYDMAQMMFNVLIDHGMEPLDSARKQAAQSAMNDWNAVPEAYREAVTSCYALGLLNGQSNGAFGGQNSMNRAQACVVIFRLMDALN